MTKSTCCFRPKIYCNINQKLAKLFILHSVEAYSELFQTSRQGGYLFGGNYFRKKLHLRCLTRFWIRYCTVNHKNNQITNSKDTQDDNFKARYISDLITGKTLKQLLNKMTFLTCKVSSLIPSNIFFNYQPYLYLLLEVCDARIWKPREILTNVLL